MKKIPFLLCLFLFSQCKQKTFESSTVDNSFVEGEIIDYQYDTSGRLIQERRKSYFVVGNKPDSSDVLTIYFYDDKGRKVKVEEHDGSDKQLLSSSFFTYDQRDSLLAEHSIDVHGDTTLLVENVYGENGSLHLQKYRQLVSNQSVDDILSGRRSYDTLFTLTENFYEAGLLIKSAVRDRQDDLVTEREYEYDGQDLVRMTVYDFPDSKKQLLLTNFYLTNDRTSNLDRVTVNIIGDTIGVKQVGKYANGKTAKIIVVNTEMGDIFITSFNEKGQVATETEIIKVIGEKTTRFFTYDSLGRKVKVVSNDEPLTENEKNVL